jgi:hypothetical protein
MRASGLTEIDMQHICTSLKTNGSIKVLDISSNPNLEKEYLDHVCEAMTSNRSLEYLGLSKLNLTTEMITPIFDMIGRFPFPEDQVEN